MKKILSCVLALITVFTACAAFAATSFAAEDTLDFSLTNAAGMQNDYVTIKMNIDNNPGFWAFEFGLFYSSDALILREVKINETFGELGEFYNFNDTIMNNLREQYDDDIEEGKVPLSRIFRDAPKYGVDVENSYLTVIEYESDDLSNDNTYTGEILELTFEVVGIAEDGDYSVTLVPDVASIINTSEKNDEVPYTWKNGVVTIGSTNAKPVEDNKQVTPEDTVKVDTEKDDETTADTQKEITIETFVEDDGKTYYIGEDGEKYEYDENSPIQGTVDSTNISGDDSTENGDESDIKVDEGTAEKERKNKTVLIIVVAAAVILIIAAVILFIFISKTKKETEEIENESKQ